MMEGYPLAGDDGRVPRGGRGVAIIFPSPKRRRGLILVAVCLGAIAIAMFVGHGTGYAYNDAPAKTSPPVGVPSSAAAAKKLQAKLVAQNKQLAAALQKLTPSGTYVVVDQTQNRLYIMNDDKIVRTSVCSAGSGMILKDSGGKKKWVFD